MTLEKLRDTYKLKVQCQCGWSGNQSELAVHPMADPDIARYCPKCEAEFRAWPEKPPTYKR